MKLTLKQIKAKKPCLDKWQKGLAFLNKKRCDNTEVTIEQIIKAVGVSSTLWVINNCIEDELDKKRNMYADIANEALKGAKKVLHIFEEKYPNDDRPRRVLKNAEENIKRRCKGTERLPNGDDACAAGAYASNNCDAAAAYAAYAATHAAYAAYAAAHAAYAATHAAYAAAHAACAAATYAAATYAADADDAVRSAARNKAIKKQAKIILKYFGEQK